MRTVSRPSYFCNASLRYLRVVSGISTLVAQSLLELVDKVAMPREEGSLVCGHYSTPPQTHLQSSPTV